MKTTLCAIATLALIVACACITTSYRANQGSDGSSTSESAYELQVADADKDGVLSESELARYRDLQRQVFESNGALMINESGELEIADKFAHDEEARAEFEKRQHMKD